jgi:hypothetical protein
MPVWLCFVCAVNADLDVVSFRKNVPSSLPAPNKIITDTNTAAARTFMKFLPEKRLRDSKYSMFLKIYESMRRKANRRKYFV